MFESLSERLNGVIKDLKGHGKLSEKNIQDALKEVRMSLLEADVNFRVVKDFLKQVQDRALGAEVMKSLTPGQQFVKIVHEELTELMGGKGQELNLVGKAPVPIMFVGLQGSGKTTSVGKTAVILKKKGRRPFLVPADVYRPAAIDQLKTLAKALHMPVFESAVGMDPVNICKLAREEAERQGCDTMIIDTAGRLSIDEAMMDELVKIKAEMKPSEILFVADAMTGQEAVNVAATFNERVDITGVVLTKMDSDARGGAALSIKAVLGKPIKLVGVGEKMDAMETFHPDRMAGRILDMGDILTLIERAEAALDEEQAKKMEEKLRKNQFTLEDFRDQLKQVRGMGGLDQLMSMIPGMNKMKGMAGMQPDESELVRIQAVIDSMTPAERKDHLLLNGSRRARVAKGSGTSIQDVNGVIKKYVQAKKLMSQMTKMGAGGMPGMPKLPGGGKMPGLGGGGGGGGAGLSAGSAKSARQRAKKQRAKAKKKRR
ncbi:MAG: signal recognition particle protein [Deltaproteobacteria bacterium]|nr:signal recognition particle protein [Deltaproteobacteria bacterium]MCB9479694.1 signal recognition particle protein [Deltaproteobacteria bacterium]MCB9488025.1 signal recognition particle protein [Deltaproteobacteria bacterium]